eukprot:10811289-Alexandrium_andersonii.AAC.1
MHVDGGPGSQGHVDDGWRGSTAAEHGLRRSPRDHGVRRSGEARGAAPRAACYAQRDKAGT